MSQIAWNADEEFLIAETLAKRGVTSIELVPPRVFSNPNNPTNEEISDCLDFWGFYGIKPIAFQSLLFQRPELRFFGNTEERQSTLSLLKTTIIAAGKLGIRALVFGSPRNRFVPSSLNPNDAWDIAVENFSLLGRLALENGTSLCIEPNPVEYGCNFVTTAAQGLAIVEEVDSEGFGLHLDLAGMWLSEDDIMRSIQDSCHVLRHFHLSSPNLGQVQENGLPYREALSALSKINYAGSISIEMVSQHPSNISKVNQSFNFIEDCLSSINK